MLKSLFQLFWPTQRIMSLHVSSHFQWIWPGLCYPTIWQIFAVETYNCSLGWEPYQLQNCHVSSCVYCCPTTNIKIKEICRKYNWKHSIYFNNYWPVSAASSHLNKSDNIWLEKMCRKNGAPVKELGEGFIPPSI